MTSQSFNGLFVRGTGGFPKQRVNNVEFRCFLCFWLKIYWTNPRVYQGAFDEIEQYFLSMLPIQPWKRWITAHMRPLIYTSIQLRQNKRDGVSNHRRHDCFFNRCLGTDQRKHQCSASLAFVRGIRRWPMDSPNKGPVKRKCFHLSRHHVRLMVFTPNPKMFYTISYVQSVLHKNLHA